MSPSRVRLSRAKGYRMPVGAVSVARPSRWGNPFRVDDCIEAGFANTVEQARSVCVDAFRSWLDGSGWANGLDVEKLLPSYLASLPELRGRDLACWCPLDQPCHADVLLDLANRGLA